MYWFFLSWEIGVKKMVFFVQDEDSGMWKCMVSIGIEEEIFILEVSK